MTKKKKPPQNRITEFQKEASRYLEITERNGSSELDLNISENDAKRATGLKKEGSIKILTATLTAALTDKNSLEIKKKNGDLVYAMLLELNPQDGYEGMLSSQIVTVFEHALESFRLANLNKYESFDVYERLQNQGIKLIGFVL